MVPVPGIQIAEKLPTRNKILAYLRGKQVECDELHKTKVFVLALKKYQLKS